MLFKEAAQDVVQQLAGIDRLQIERGFATRLNSQDAIAEKAEGAIPVSAQTAGAVHMLRAEVPRQHQTQVGIGDLTVIGAKPLAMTSLLDTDPAQRGI